jgi:hypothetical protein
MAGLARADCGGSSNLDECWHGRSAASSHGRSTASSRLPYRPKKISEIPTTVVVAMMRCIKKRTEMALMEQRTAVQAAPMAAQR